MNAPKIHDEQAAASALAAQGLVHWSVREGQLYRCFRTADWRSSLLLANGLALQAEAAWHHPELRINWGRVEVLLFTHSAGGITDMDLALAARLESVASWQPAPDSALAGTPPDERWRYLLAD